MVLQAIRYNRGSLQILDQLQLPYRELYEGIRDTKDAWDAIKQMRVRGAPAIAIVAALSLAVELQNVLNTDGESMTAGDMVSFVGKKLEYLVTSRPTAVNLADAARKLKTVVADAHSRAETSSGSIGEAYMIAAERMLVDDVQDNENIGRHGAEWILGNTVWGREGKVSVLTHCNTGSLATAGYGTALGVIRALQSRSSLHHAYCCETRPYNQGARLTAYELVHDDIPGTLITDSMAAALLRTKGQADKIAAVVVGADRVAANGDTANKIGTYALAILARHHGVKFLVAAPRTTVDMNTLSGDEIVVEQRPSIEVAEITGPRVQGSKEHRAVDLDHIETVGVAAPGIEIWNPAFDVTPAGLIDGIVTEVGVVEKRADGRFRLSDVFDAEVRGGRADGRRKRTPSPSEGP
ncbi:methylthioribose-1-phosphate isomerase [Lasallia pustulata]|uniref:Methylthioribose-1-phosphate isomerase n=1 Tax=Lasallia pustulata TaxID=136370 RepID=A0A1W5D1N7_9LECA|nr:methylthioribose-1-phosphate isomerase [Lasallia pustulata]